MTLRHAARVRHFVEIPWLPAMVKNDLLVKVVQFVEHKYFG
jgi:hypothetical protein